jgi:7-carboxy-7-deazaguanine synthase
MLGTNEKLSPTKGNGETLDVTEIFATIQGEGPHAGVPAVFIRLGGCNLACKFCDTDFETRQTLSVTDIVAQADTLSRFHPHPSPLPEGEGAKRTHHLIVLTGGEPFRQPINALCQALLDVGFAVQIETNGTLWREIPEAVQIICSPKAPDGSYFPLREDILPRITALKFLVSASRPAYQTIPELGQTVHQIPVYVQPIDEQDPQKNRDNFHFAAKLVQEQGLRLCIQLHKVVGIA